MAMVAIVCVMLIEIVALLMGIDGLLLTATVGAICAIVAGVVGYAIPSPLNK